MANCLCCLHYFVEIALLTQYERQYRNDKTIPCSKRNCSMTIAHRVLFSSCACQRVVRLPQNFLLFAKKILVTQQRLVIFENVQILYYVNTRIFLNVQFFVSQQHRLILINVSTSTVSTSSYICKHITFEAQQYFLILLF